MTRVLDGHPKPDLARKAKKPQLVFFYSKASGRCRRVEAFLAQVLQARRNHDTFVLHRVEAKQPRAHSALRGRAAADDHRDRRKPGPWSARAAAAVPRSNSCSHHGCAKSPRAKADQRSPLAPSWKSMPATSSSNHGPRRILSASRSTDQSFALLVCRRASLLRYGGKATEPAELTFLFSFPAAVDATVPARVPSCEVTDPPSMRL